MPVVAIVALGAGAVWFVHRPRGMTAELGLTCGPTSATVDVTLADRGREMMGDGLMMAALRAQPTTAPAGRVTIRAHNAGALVHELVVLPVGPNGVGTRPVGPDDRLSERGSLGEASRSCGPGAGEGITPGRTGWVTLTLEPGQYELVCNEAGHYAAGMYDLLTVT